MELTGLAPVSSPPSWHLAEWAHLYSQLEEGRLPHALLLVGARYTGKSRLALALARLLLCAQPADGLNCGKCHACKLSGSGGHGDFRWVEPEESSRVIKIGQVRDLLEFAGKTAGFGQRKVVVLAPADTMNTHAFNALLKSLEEPAPDTYLVLVCHSLHNVPATIRSRCRLLRLPIPDEEASLAWLEQTTGDGAGSAQLLSLADGRPGLARQLYLDDSAAELVARREGFRALLEGKVGASQLAAAWDGEPPEEFLGHLAAELQRLVLSLSAEQLRSSAGRAAFAMLDETARLLRAVSAGANPGRELLMEAMLSKIHRELGPGLSG